MTSIGYQKGSKAETAYFFTRNAQGDVIAVYRNSDSKLIGTYEYDLWGKLVSVKEATKGIDTDGILTKNPIRYRGYYYDNETGYYHLPSRYYNPEVRRWLNADNMGYLGVGSNITSYNLFAYCGNNPVMGCDPTGHWDWGGVIAGVGLVAATVIIIATCGVGTPVGALVAGIAIATGTVTTYAAATDSAMVMDTSLTAPVTLDTYGKLGGSIVIDFKNDNANFYLHKGGGYGYSMGIGYSVGLVDNYEEPADYERHFVDVNYGNGIGLDYCRDPFPKDGIPTQATSVTFSTGYNYGIGYDYYESAYQISAW